MARLALVCFCQDEGPLRGMPVELRVGRVQDDGRQGIINQAEHEVLWSLEPLPHAHNGALDFLKAKMHVREILKGHVDRCYGCGGLWCQSTLLVELWSVCAARRRSGDVVYFSPFSCLPTQTRDSGL